MRFNKIKIIVGSALFSLTIGLILFINGCHKEDIPDVVPFSATPYNLKIPQFFPTRLNIPEDNPLTVEGVQLGRYLFYDTRLCGYLGTNPDSMLSCANCHVQATGFDIGTNNPRFPNGEVMGLGGVAPHHNVMPLINLIFNNEGYFWNGMVCESNPHIDRRNLEDIVRMAITGPDEMNSTAEKTVAAIAGIPTYPPMFKKAFGTEEVTMDRIKKAIAQFIRTLISGNSKFDKFMRGEVQLTNSELRGYILFTTEEGADCFHCHGSEGTPLFTTNLFYNNALDSIFDDPHDRYGYTGNPSDIGAYRAPTLRNVVVTAPYMRDGRFETLDEVLRFYNEGLIYSPYVHPLMHKINQGGALLTPPQLEDLKAFLNTLTDEEFLTNPQFANPH
ncbi:MAG TPA: cytochrome c peroxidase [Bacteroidales bacterium]|jgi:cytochrome c peroxidase|nr:cytochrome-c peroxidase [Bacteroidales bacterium]HOS58414.1 cytochrome c peroxidase [Bacteroidales bacterium]HRR03857.1 cytochrome c peroxidase [Bacteroidales bacterium]HXK74204.1 cytochrome c peroxidase [Bacteroidales bacterium]